MSILDTFLNNLTTQELQELSAKIDSKLSTLNISGYRILSPDILKQYPTITTLTGDFNNLINFDYHYIDYNTKISKDQLSKLISHQQKNISWFTGQIDSSIFDRINEYSVFKIYYQFINPKLVSFTDRLYADYMTAKINALDTSRIDKRHVINLFHNYEYMSRKLVLDSIKSEILNKVSINEILFSTDTAFYIDNEELFIETENYKPTAMNIKFTHIDSIMLLIPKNATDVSFNEIMNYVVSNRRDELNKL